MRTTRAARVVCIASLLALSCAEPPTPALLHRLARTGDITALTSLLPHTPPSVLSARISGEGVLIPLLRGWQAAFQDGAPPGADHRACLTALLDAGADPSDSVPLLDAVVLRNVPAFDALMGVLQGPALIDSLCTVDTNGESVFHAAAKSTSSGVARVLMRAALDSREGSRIPPSSYFEIDDDAWTAAVEGIRSTRALPVASILASTAPSLLPRLLAAASALALPPEETFTLRDNEGRTPLYLACAGGVVPGVAALLDVGADPLELVGVEGGHRTTCLHAAAAGGWVDVLREVAHRGASSPDSLASSWGVAVDSLGRSVFDVGEDNADVMPLQSEFLRSIRAYPDRLLQRRVAPAPPLSSRVGWVPGFNVSAHESLGWRVASPSLLRNLSLPGDLFHHHPEGATTQGGTFDLPACGVEVLTAADVSGPLLPAAISAGRPFVVRTGWKGAGTLSRAELEKRMGGERVQIGSIPYESTYRGGAPRTTTLSRFLAEQSGGDTPGDPPYVFDGRVLWGRSANLFADAIAAFPAVWRPSGPSTLQLRQLAVGPPGSGAQPHFHRAAANLLLFGIKLWVLVPPSDASFVDAHAAVWWRGYVQQGAAVSVAAGGGGAAPECPGGTRIVQLPGDVVFVPPGWGHAALALTDAAAIALENGD